MANGRRTAIGLALVVVVATGAVVWLSRGAEEVATPTSVIALPAPTAPGRQPKPVQVEPPRRVTRQVAPEPVSPMDAVPPKDGDLAAESRRMCGGTLSMAVEGVVDPSWHGHSKLMWYVFRGWGTQGTRAVLDAASARFEAAKDRRWAAALLALSETEFRLGHEAAAAERLVQAVLAMDPDWPWDLGGRPRLPFFAGGPNVVPWRTSDYDDFRRAPAESHVFTISGFGNWDGASPLPWDERGGPGQWFFAWVRTLATDDTQPEPAMAATIWVHSVTSRHNWQPPRLPAAALARVVEALGAPLPAAATLDEWRKAFAACRKAAEDRGDAWALALAGGTESLRRCDTMAGVVRFPVADSALVIWSLSDEFARRFAKVDTHRADTLRKLAARLVEFEEAQAPDAAAPK